MRFIGFIGLIHVISHNNNYIHKEQLKVTKPQVPEVQITDIIFCKYEMDCKLPYTCHKIFGKYGICKYNDNLIPVRILNN
jgi:hypothetical protein